MLTQSGSSALAWTPIVAAAIVVAVRLFVRYNLRVISVEDYLMTLALIFAIISASLAVTLFWDHPVTPSEIGQFRTVNTLASVTAYISLYFSKTSVGFFLLRLLGPTKPWHRSFIITTLAGLAILTFLVLIDVFLPVCTDKNVATSVTGCLTPDVHVGFDQAWNFYAVFFDLAYSTLPIQIIYKLNMSTSKKVGISVLLGLGWIAAVFTLLRALAEYNLWSLDTTSLIVKLATAMEQGLVMICGSLVTLSPLFSHRWIEALSRSRSNLRSPAYTDKQNLVSSKARNGGEVVSTVETGSGSTRLASVDNTSSAIHVHREFGIGLDHHDSS